MRETIVEIGQQSPIVGVLCKPEQLSNEHTAVILLNSGVMHRVGACRLSVRIARAICQQTGLMSVRFDFPYIGDSPPRNAESSDFGLIAVDEVREVMDFLQQTRGIKQFILYGLCSGAHTSLQVGLVDDRVIGVAQINGNSYAPMKSTIRWYLSKFRADRLLLTIKNFIKKILKNSPSNLEVQDESSYFEVPKYAARPDRAIMVDWYSKLIAKKIQLFSIYTEQNIDYFYHNQFYDCFGEVDFGDQLWLDYLPEASHLIEQPKYQERVINDIVNWVSRFNP